MYDYIGEKIKVLAKALFIVGAILTFILGIVLLLLIEVEVWVGIIVFICGPIVAFISSWVLYGFGEIIEILRDIECNTRPDESSQKPDDDEQRMDDADDAEDSVIQVVCPRCGAHHDFDYPRCPKCKYEYDMN